MKAKGKDV